MADYIVILLVALIAFFGGGWWTILIAAVGLSIGTWHDLWLLVRRYPHTQLDWHIMLHVVRAWCVALAAVGGAYIVGALAGDGFRVE